MGQLSQMFYALVFSLYSPKVSGLEQSTWCTLVLCLVLLQVPKCFVVVQIFCDRPKTYLHIVAVTNILCQLNDDLHSVKLFFVPVQKVLKRH